MDYMIEHAESFLSFLNTVQDSKSTYQLGVFRKGTSKFIGMVTLENIDYKSKSCELGYWLSYKYTGRGLAFEATTELMKFAIDELTIKHFDAYVVTENIDSIKLLEKLGFKRI